VAEKLERGIFERQGKHRKEFDRWKLLRKKGRKNI
jgi:hypothetical protein